MNPNTKKSNQNNYIEKLRKPVEFGKLSLFILNSFLDYTHQEGNRNAKTKSTKPAK